MFLHSTATVDRMDIDKPFGLPCESGILNDNIRYLCIYHQRNDELTQAIPLLMNEFSNTDALIIDARQCGGGVRGNQQALFPFFMSPENSPYIANVAKLRVPERERDIMDWGVGSAGDIFVLTFKSLRNFTLVGTASNGRSDNSRNFVLDNSGLPVRLSTMASFQKTGEKHDTVGIQPDIVIEAQISDWLEQSDTVLDRATTLATESILSSKLEMQ